MSAVVQDLMPFIRPMRADDLPAVIEVEHDSYTHPWSEGIIRDCLRVGYSCWVCELGDQIVGHTVMSVATGEAHLLNICIGPRWQGLGLGRRLLRRMLRIAGQRHADTMFLEVRDGNEGARWLYESEGFGEIGRRRGYYPAHSGREDAIVYAKALF